MAKIVRNPNVPDRVKMVDHKRYAHAPEELSAELTDWYENGYLLVLQNYKFEAGCETFNKLLFPNQKYAAKTILHVDEEAHGEAPRKREWEEMAKLLGPTDVEYEEFQSAVGAANAELIRLADSLFPFYRYEKRYCVYNLTEMLAHNMHFDSPQHAGEFSQLRIFVNLDAFPRIWRVGGTIEHVAGDCYETAKLQDTIGLHPRQFTRATTVATYGDRYNSGAHNQPMHSIAFQPGEVWFLNPNMVAHEVVYGRRLLDGVFLFNASYLRNPERYYPAIVEDLHKQKLGRGGYWWRTRKAAIAARVRSGISRLSERR
ncbi:hypothetical protein G7077_08595 [Sphingomonas piscis]|uniref:Uncharacterized protein n=1 Tax=Sphingomonas piscis TaxID=2714943 RepID=A0A6G7YQD4_9SPHN|nr:Kdo hydroxylase family protein [Sphingomonas piscis]QIK78944.1 hypothetical protein G7077_08595 [Sphingomonas piscis]